MNKAPAYQWYPKDILASSRVGEMTAEEECWYRRALDFCWVNGSVPADPDRLARLIGKGATANGLRVVIKMFVPARDDADRLVHDRQELERQKQQEWRDKSAKGGKAGRGKRKKTKSIGSEKGGSDLVTTKVATKSEPNDKQIDTLQSSLSSLQSSSLPPTTTPPQEEKRPPQAAPPQKKGTRIPEPFLLTKEMRDFAHQRRPNVDVAEETEKFCNHYRSAPGSKGVKLDWNLTWKNWILNAKGNSNATNRPNNNRATNADRIRQTQELVSKYPTEAELAERREG